MSRVTSNKKQLQNETNDAACIVQLVKGSLAPGRLYMLLRLPLVSFTFNFIMISLSGTQKVTKDKQSSEFVLQRSVLNEYAEQEAGLSHLNLHEFA